MIFKNILVASLCFITGIIFSDFKTLDATKQITATKNNITITFKNVVSGASMILNDSSYTNPFGEVYTIKKFKYYITNVRLNYKNGSFKESNSYHLIDQNKPGSLSFGFNAGNQHYHSITFLLGVDSLRNVSGAQTGALDPANDMFWTWNSGYVMAKLEGNSTASTLVNNMFEYHIGGYAGENKVLKKITLQFPEVLDIDAKNSAEININADANAWFKNVNDIRIAVNAGITSPGLLAKKVSDNYCNMFSIASVKILK